MELNSINTAVTFTAHRSGEQHKKKDHHSGVDKVALVSSSLGTIASIMLIRKMQGRVFDPKKLSGTLWNKIKQVNKAFFVDYQLKELIVVANASILSGLLGAKLFSDESQLPAKTKESVFQMLNTTLATTAVASLIKLAENSKKFNNNFSKIIATGLGLTMGIPSALFVAKRINANIFGEDEFTKRKLKKEDLMVHTDDLVSACILAGFPVVNKLPLDKILAFIFTKVGYEATSDK